MTRWTSVSGRAGVTALAAALFVVPACAAAGRADGVVDKVENTEIDRLVRDVCRKDIVLLGEDAGHGGGRTFEIKIEVVKRLVARCGFDAVVFESQFYDVLDYEHAIADGSATPQKLAGAVGALWVRAQESAPLIAYLHREAAARRIRVAGIDPQVGGVMGEYVLNRLGSVLAAQLQGERRDACRIELDRHNAWRYDDANPFDDAARQRLRACSDDIRAAIATRDGASSSEVAAMAAAFSRYLDMTLTGDGDMRDLSMYENLRWHLGRWPEGTKTIVWCATVHAASSLVGVAEDMRPMGGHVRAAFGDRAAAIGFTALSGRFGKPGAAGGPQDLAPAPVGSLEAVVLGESDAGLRYVDHGWLARLGIIAARPINYRKMHTAPWADMLDGLVVLREERAAEPIHEPGEVQR